MHLIWARTIVGFAVVTSILKCLQSEALLYRYVFLKMTQGLHIFNTVTGYYIQRDCLGWLGCKHYNVYSLLCGS